MKCKCSYIVPDIKEYGYLRHRNEYHVTCKSCGKTVGCFSSHVWTVKDINDMIDFVNRRNERRIND